MEQKQDGTCCQAGGEPPPLPEVKELVAADFSDAGLYEKHVLVGLLKEPRWLACRIAEGRELIGPCLQLLIWGLLLHAFFGFAMALFDSLGTAAVSSLKAALMAACALSLCLPSLYVFSCVAGMPVSLTQAVTIGGAALAMTGLLLLGLAPVSWLFSVSTDNLPFVVVANVMAWLIAVSFGMRFFRVLQGAVGSGGSAGFRWWFRTCYRCVVWHRPNFRACGESTTVDQHFRKCLRSRGYGFYHIFDKWRPFHRSHDRS